MPDETSEELKKYNRDYYQRNRKHLLENKERRIKDLLKIEESGWWNTKKV